jgi:hypothetical protein
MENLRSMPAHEVEAFIRLLKTRFEKYMNRHSGLEWLKIQARLENHPGKPWALHEMERTGCGWF